ncbi:putative folylpolyglutamate synthase [Varroa jacobsoni]|uniref:Folylpolyglutamate synthase n=1 Tax=Varroa destructor TaxID=109461 RepID=A0A7M7KPH9_VARDE|nr:putative folylpolyglutamate synthase [Varroa destructor]XP_022688406.1 putative folylpolyglutamate synthase [Varroa jacobsoni]
MGTVVRTFLRHFVRDTKPSWQVAASKLQRQRNFCFGCEQVSVMCASRGYEEAVAQLNRLQSNSSAIEDSLRTRQALAPLVYTKCTSYLHELRIEQKHLTALRVVHVSGTKGKGSTCAFTESILRSYGYKTGFYSSPHLLAIRERIRINGRPISKDLFAKHFWETYDVLRDFERRSGEKVPMYFTFLTMMAFRLFVHEKVHVAIIEVGIGGEYDSTNVVDQPSVVGITSLSIDHAKLLGNTIEKIAWHKGGIMKFLVPAFTASQPLEAMRVLQKKAIERRCDLYVVPSLQLYDTAGQPVQLGIPGKVQLENASLAVQLAHFWIKKNDPYRFPQVEWGVTLRDDVLTLDYGDTSMILARPFSLPTETLKGLESCRWPGRCQLLNRGNVAYFLDGAHTVESMEECARWFGQYHQTSSSRLKVLLFHCTGDRSSEALLAHLKRLFFEIAIFSPVCTYMQSALSADNSNFTLNGDRERNKCFEDEATFLRICNGHQQARTYTVDCIADAVKKIKMIAEEKKAEHKKLSVLVTGSLHLVGNTLSIIDPRPDYL